MLWQSGRSGRSRASHGRGFWANAGETPEATGPFRLSRVEIFTPGAAAQQVRTFGQERVEIFTPGAAAQRVVPG